MNAKISCPICSGREVEAFLKHKDTTINVCKNCTALFVHPVPSLKVLGRYYKKGYFEGKNKGVLGYKDYAGLERDLDMEALLRLKYMIKRVNKGNLLDVGAGTGVFAEAAQRSGFLVSANDISSYAISALKKKGIKSYRGNLSKEILPKNAFDVITAWDVIEHVPDVDEMMEGIQKAMKVGGYFFLTTPDTGSWDAKLMGKNWYGYKKVPEHLLFFNRKAITKLFEAWGFEVVGIKTWGFYRNLNFILDKLKNYDPSFSLAGRIIDFLSLGSVSFFYPMTDFMVVGRKKEN